MVEDACVVALMGADADNVEIIREFGPVGEVVLDRIQIQQIIINLLRNAMDAMRDSPERRLTIATARAGQFAEIRVADTGQGLPPEGAARLFEPFVSGKPDGVGIGLSICRSIVDAHQGELLVEPNTPTGATFKVRLPITRREHAYADK